MEIFKKEIIDLLSKNTNLKKEEINEVIEIPPDDKFGDFAFPCFILAKHFKKSPNDISKELANKIKPTKGIEQIIAVGPYLNFFINKQNLAEEILKDLKKKVKGKKEVVMVEFSQANTHKAFHVGHIRGTSIGESLSRVLEHSGKKVIRANYQGDIGMHVAKWMWCYLNYHKKEKLRGDEAWVASIYVDAVKRLAQNDSLQQEVDEINRKLDKREDKKLLDLWKKSRAISLKALEKIYRDLNTKFNAYYFEKDIEQKGKEISNGLLKKKIAILSDGAVIMDLKEYNLGVWVLLRKDGTVLYSAKDLALAEKKFKDYKLDKSIYVVGAEQKLHLQQLAKTLKLMQFKDSNKFIFINFELVRLPTGKMSSRTGDNILYSEFKKEVMEYSKKEIKKRFPKLGGKELEKRALAISIAAIKYDMLKQDSGRVIVFVKEEALNFEGNTGPYLLYSYARAASIIRKSQKVNKGRLDNLNEIEIKLIKELGNFNDVVNKAALQLNPVVIANYAFSLAQIFNEFYHSCPVLKAEKETKQKRLILVKAFKEVLGHSIKLLGIEPLEKM